MPMRERLLRSYERMQQVLAPGVRYSQTTYEEVLRAYVAQSAGWLDLGCGRRILPPWREDAEQALVAGCPCAVGADVDLGALAENRSLARKCLASGDALPFADESFDLVTANMVVEHLATPATHFREIARVLRPGGAFLLHTPNARGYPTLLARIVPEALKKRGATLLDGRRDVEVYPTFYRANSRGALEAAARAGGFEAPDLRFIVTTAMFAVVPPLAFVELLWLRLLLTRRFTDLRTNIIAVLRKRGASGANQPRRSAFSHAASINSVTRGHA